MASLSGRHTIKASCQLFPVWSKLIMHAPNFTALAFLYLHVYHSSSATNISCFQLCFCIMANPYLHIARGPYNVTVFQRTFSLFDSVAGWPLSPGAPLDPRSIDSIVLGTPQCDDQSCLWIPLPVIIWWAVVSLPYRPLLELLDGTPSHLLIGISTMVGVTCVKCEVKNINTTTATLNI